MRAFTLFLISSFIVSIFACKKEATCDATMLTPSLVFEFYGDSANKKTGKQDTFKFPLRDTLTIYGIDAKDSILKKSLNIQTAQLPLDISSTSTKYVFAIKNIQTATVPSILSYDTLAVNYSLQREFVSQVCGFKYLFPEVNYNMTQHRVNTIQILQNKILDEKTTHIRLFFNF